MYLAQEKHYEKYGFDVIDESKDVLNPITNELNTLRTSILTNLIEAVSNNTKHGFKKIAFFENGTIFDKDRNEKKSLAFIFSGDKEIESISNSGKPESIDFFEFAAKVSSVIGKFELVPMKEISNKLIHPYQNGKIIVDGEVIGYISKLHPVVSKEYDISDSTFICEVDFDKISSEFNQSTRYLKIPKLKKRLKSCCSKSTRI